MANYKCGRPLKAGEKKCPACKSKQHSLWKKIGSGAIVVASVAVAIISKGKIKIPTKGA